MTALTVPNSKKAIRFLCNRERHSKGPMDCAIAKSRKNMAFVMALLLCGMIAKAVAATVTVCYIDCDFTIWCVVPASGCTLR